MRYALLKSSSINSQGTTMSKKKRAAGSAKASQNGGLLDQARQIAEGGFQDLQKRLPQDLVKQLETSLGRGQKTIQAGRRRQRQRQRQRHHGGPEVAELDALQLLSPARQVEPLDPEQADTAAFGGVLGPNVLRPGEGLPTNSLRDSLARKGLGFGCA